MDSSCLLSLFVLCGGPARAHLAKAQGLAPPSCSKACVSTIEEALGYGNHYEIMPFTRLLSHRYHEVWKTPVAPLSSEAIIMSRKAIDLPRLDHENVKYKGLKKEK